MTMHIPRRKFLISTGLASSGILAGCLESEPIVELNYTSELDISDTGTGVFSIEGEGIIEYADRPVAILVIEIIDNGTTLATDEYTLRFPDTHVWYDWSYRYVFSPQEMESVTSPHAEITVTNAG